MKNIYIKSALLAFTLLGTLVSCDNDYADEKPSIANIAVTNPDFSTLEAAAIQGGVAVTLSNSNPNDITGSYTVFAPTNAAFAKLGIQNGGDLSVLQNSFLTNTLLYHVSSGNTYANQFIDGNTTTSAIGVTRRFINRNNELYINGSKIILTNVSASNGAVHGIDKVMIATGVNIVESALLLNDAKVFKIPELTFLVQAVLRADLAGVLSDPNGNFTIYAPTDAAFVAAGFPTAQAVAEADPAFLRTVLLNHAVGGGMFTSEQTSTTATTAGGNTLTYSPFQNGVFTILGNGNTIPANMVIPDIQCSNGIVHIIDRVLLP